MLCIPPINHHTHIKLIYFFHIWKPIYNTIRFERYKSNTFISHQHFKYYLKGFLCKSLNHSAVCKLNFVIMSWHYNLSVIKYAVQFPYTLLKCWPNNPTRSCTQTHTYTHQGWWWFDKHDVMFSIRNAALRVCLWGMFVHSCLHSVRCTISGRCPRCCIFERICCVRFGNVAFWQFPSAASPPAADSSRQNCPFREERPNTPIRSVKRRILENKQGVSTNVVTLVWRCCGTAAFSSPSFHLMHGV